MIYTPELGSQLLQPDALPRLDLAFPLFNLLDELGVAQHLKGG